MREADPDGSASASARHQHRSCGAMTERVVSTVATRADGPGSSTVRARQALARMASTPAVQTNTLIGRVAERAFEQAQPRPGGRREVRRQARITPQPALDDWMPVRGVVVHDRVRVEVRRRPAVDRTAELRVLQVSAPRHAGANRRRSPFPEGEVVLAHYTTVVTLRSQAVSSRVVRASHPSHSLNRSAL